LSALQPFWLEDCARAAAAASHLQRFPARRHQRELPCAVFHAAACR
jgi:hypothetical protein